MKKFTLSLFFLLGITLFLNAQVDPDQTIMTIAGREISAGEFERIYRKNNNDNVTQKQSVEEYLDMFINFKLKVIEAEEQGMDTASSFLKEFNSYKKQLAKPYLTNPDITEHYALEAYERMKEEVNASHIMIRLDENASPADTLKAWEKLIEIREKLMQGGDLETLARAASDDPSAKTNGGSLGWFSTFRMVYEFETVAYNTSAGEISMPFRTSYGMHILKVNEKRPALGSVRIAHIFVRAPQSMTKEEAEEARIKAYAILDSLKNGADFGKMASIHSDDRTSADNGGIIPWIHSGQMIKVFDDAAFGLENPGDFSEAVKSSFGYHIIKLLDKKPVGSYEDEKPGILQKMKSGERANLSKEAFILSLKKEYNYYQDEEVLRKAISFADSSLTKGEWDKNKMEAVFDEVLFTCGDMKVRVEDFSDYLLSHKRNKGITNPETLALMHYSNFEKEKILSFEEDNLVNKHDDYKHILQEYHDGILLFDLTDKTIWSKAVKDSAGLENFYKHHKEDYKWDQRAEAFTVSVIDSAKIDEVRKLTAKLIKKRRFSDEKLMNAFCKDDTIESCLKISSGAYEKGDNQYVDQTEWKKGMGDIYYANDVPSFIVVTDILKPSVKKLSETRGQVTADYQKFLEEKWIAGLRKKYDFNVNMDLLKKIKDQ